MLRENATHRPVLKVGGEPMPTDLAATARLVAGRVLHRATHMSLRALLLVAIPLVVNGRITGAMALCTLVSPEMSRWLGDASPDKS